MLPSLPIKIDLFAIIILLGVVQGFFLAFFFLTTKKGNKVAHRYLGLFLFSMAFAITEVLLGYTNYTFQTLYLVDMAEPLNFTVAPLSFLYIQTYITERFTKSQLLHFIPFFAYLIYMSVLFYPLPDTHHYNSYLYAFHPEMTRVHCDYTEKEWYYFFKHHVNDLMFAHMVVYTLASFYIVFKAFKKEGLKLSSNQHTKLSWARNQSVSLASIVVIFLVVKRTFIHDLGDHILAGHITLIIYAISFSVISRSKFFHDEQQVKPTKKYEKSSLTSDIQDNTLSKLTELMETEKPFLNASFSLPTLAKMLAISPHHLSQILNEKIGQSFFDYIAAYRIREAQQLLSSPENAHIKIEEIAEMVGYNSKSAFNTSFKKIVGQTPSQFRILK
ncbi:helix-turn-helix domain-containing protein [Emticicia soli]|uniref:Helix-turn-helix domain-containing protein n=1 Tax=Emticicia soli TaxID=2027878 RepID=A0ABW5JCN6_9BACT